MEEGLLLSASGAEARLVFVSLTVCARGCGLSLPSSGLALSSVHLLGSNRQSTRRLLGMRAPGPVPGQGDFGIDPTMIPVPGLLAPGAHRGLRPLAFFPDAATPLCSSVTLLSFPRSGQPNTAIWGRVTFPVRVSKYQSGCEIDQTRIKINFYRVTDYSPPGGTRDSLFIWGLETWLGPWGPRPTPSSPRLSCPTSSPGRHAPRGSVGMETPPQSG